VLADARGVHAFVLVVLVWRREAIVMGASVVGLVARGLALLAARALDRLVRRCGSATSRRTAGFTAACGRTTSIRGGVGGRSVGGWCLLLVAMLLLEPLGLWEAKARGVRGRRSTALCVACRERPYPRRCLRE
jgi:hypothetical protein